VISPPRTSRARILDLVNGLRVMRHHLITPPHTIILLRYLGLRASLRLLGTGEPHPPRCASHAAGGHDSSGLTFDCIYEILIVPAPRRSTGAQKIWRDTPPASYRVFLLVTTILNLRARAWHFSFLVPVACFDQPHFLDLCPA
jgi:hypothetical protein